MLSIQISIPRRLHYLRVLVTLSLILSFFLSLDLWGGATYYPDKPATHSLATLAPYSFHLLAVSIISLLFSLVHTHHRLFLFLSLCLNVVLVFLDLNRMQPWFFVYNAILFALLFNDGRVDNQARFTSIFISVQCIIAATYIFNGLSQFNTHFLQGDFQETISPLSAISSARQHDFYMNAGKFVPFLILLNGVGLLIYPARFIFITFSLLFHLTLLILLFPSPHNSNHALWLMNLSFIFFDLLLFWGETRQRYFSPFILLQKPLFYMVLFAFWVVPALELIQGRREGMPGITFRNGRSSVEQIVMKDSEYKELPLYLRHFCEPQKEKYILKVEKWCRHELRSESMTKIRPEMIFQQPDNNVANVSVKDSEDQLSSL